MAGDRPIIVIALSAFLVLAFIAVIVLAVRLNNYECPESSGDDQANVRHFGLPYYGKLVGDLPTLDHGLRGTVYVVDDKRLRIRHLYYDGRAPAAYFWVGVKRISNEKVDTSGVAIPNEYGTNDLLLRYNNADITLTLPGNMTVNNLKWFSMWCKRVEMSFGHVFFAPDFDVPHPREIGQFQKSAGISSGPITVLDDKTIFIQNFAFDGRVSNGYFAGGNNKTQRTISPFQFDSLDGSLTTLTTVFSANVTLIFPMGLSIFDIDYIGIFYTDKTAPVMLDSVSVPPSLNVPANVKKLQT